MDKTIINKINSMMLTLDQSYDPVRFAQLKADSYNRDTGKLTGYDCPKCLNRGNFMIVWEDCTVAIQDCDCLIRRRNQKYVEESGLKDFIKEKTFDTFEATEPWQRKIKQGAIAFAEHPSGWIVFCGQSGCGKTHICTAICGKLMTDGIEVKYLRWRDEIPRLKALATDLESREKRIAVFKTVSVLYIDDLFKTGLGADGICKPTSADINTIFEILDARYMAGLVTIISTELSPQELLTIDEALGGRIREKALGHIFPIERKPGRNYRLKSNSKEKQPPARNSGSC